MNDKLCRFLFFVALRDASAGRVTAVAPYLCYARKDRKSKARDPVTTRYVPGLFEAVGIDRIVTMDVHNLAAFQNAFRVRTRALGSQEFVRRLLCSTRAWRRRCGRLAGCRRGQARGGLSADPRPGDGAAGSQCVFEKTS